VKAPRDCIDYVITHELAHLRYHDHGEGFQRLIDQHVPGWKNRKRHLDGLVEVIMVD